MALENLSIHRDAHNADALKFTCCAKSIRKAESVILQIPKPKNKRAQPKKSLGKQPAKDLDKPETLTSTSGAVKIWDNLKNLLSKVELNNY